MEAHDPQSRVDAEEERTVLRYAQLQALLDSLREPIKRADAVARLEAWLNSHPPVRSTSA